TLHKITGTDPINVTYADPTSKARGCRSRGHPFSSTARADGPLNSNVVRFADRSVPEPGSPSSAATNDAVSSAGCRSDTTRNSSGESHSMETSSPIVRAPKGAG